jgi:hypothetical protein
LSGAEAGIAVAPTLSKPPENRQQEGAYAVDLFVTRAAMLARSVETAQSRRAFRSAVEEFEHLLSRVADYPSDFLTDTEARALSSMADAVVDRIEQRLDARADRGAVQRDLVRQIYKMRLDVENIYMVLRHPAVTTAAQSL